MNKKHEIFAYEYVVDFNGAEAAIRAGYSKNRARITASEILKREDVQNLIAEITKEALDQLGINFLTTLRRIKTWFESDITQAMCLTAEEIKELPKEIRQLITEFTVVTKKLRTKAKGESVEETIEETIKIKFVSKEKAGEMINKYIGLYKEDNEQQGAAIERALLVFEKGKSTIEDFDKP